MRLVTGCLATMALAVCNLVQGLLDPGIVKDGKWLCPFDSSIFFVVLHTRTKPRQRRTDSLAEGDKVEAKQGPWMLSPLCRYRVTRAPWMNFLLLQLFLFVIRHWPSPSPTSTLKTSDKYIMQLNEPSWISLEPNSHAIYDTFVSFLDSASTPEQRENAQELVESTIATMVSIGTQQPSVDQYRFESRMLFGILFTIVKQLDAAANAAQQDHLIKLVLSIRDLPLPTSVAEQIATRDIDSDMNRDLSKLKNVFADLNWDAPLHPPLAGRFMPIVRSPRYSPWGAEPGRYLTPSEWANVNAFAARLHAAAPDLHHWDLRGLYAMVEALEQPLTQTPLEDVLPAAANWIIYAGEELQRNSVPYAKYGSNDSTKRLACSRGELWKGPLVFNRARWAFWMQRFIEIAEMDGVSDTVRMAALRAVEAGSKRTCPGQTVACNGADIDVSEEEEIHLCIAWKERLE